MDLTQKQLKELFHYDPETGVFTWLCTRGKGKIGAEAGALTPEGYIYIGVNGRRWAAHRLAWLYVYGVWPIGALDHADRQRGNNRVANLREASSAENAQNNTVSKSSKTGVLGVTYAEGGSRPYRAVININGKTKHIGRFKTLEQAKSAYLSAKVLYHPFYKQQEETCRIT